MTRARRTPAALVLLAGTVVAVSSTWARPISSDAPLPEGTTVHRDVAYVENGHERQRLDLYIPPGQGPRPVIVYIHGGAWTMGDKADAPPLEYLSQGYALAALNYRLSQHALFPAQIEDCKAAVRWLRAHSARYGLDPDRLVAGGASAGGHLAALLGTTGDVTELDVGAHPDVSSRVRAVVDFFGPTDFLQMDAHRLPGGMVHDGADSPESRLVGGPIQDNPEKVARANPITYVRPGAPPFLIVHGDRDPLVPHHQSELLASVLEDASVPVTLYTVVGGGHGGFQDPRVDELVREFLERYLE
jgi:acetyl esterase/lipase